VTTVVSLGVAPVLLLVLGSFRHRRPPPIARGLAVAISVVGLALVCLTGGPLGGATHPTFGIAAALCSGAAYGLSAEAARPLTRELDTLTITTAATTVAAIVMVPIGLTSTAIAGDPMTTAAPGSWLLIAYLGAVTLALAYALLYAGLRTNPSGSVVVATLLEPVTAVAIAALLLGERLAAPGVVGTLLILGAIASLGRQSDEPTPH
jgi:DME family drug/metabolite transporter